MANKLCLVTAWYEIGKKKFDTGTYRRWANNMLNNVYKYNLVIYTDKESSDWLFGYEKNPNIKIVIKPIEEFYTYKYKDYWEKNHSVNYELNEKVHWSVNMLWNEKIYFVYDTIQNTYFESDFFCWADLGYFREYNPEDSFLKDWPNTDKINKLNKDLIYYNRPQKNSSYMNYIIQLVNNKNEKGLPVSPLPANQVSIGGGFFICHKEKIEFWKNLFYDKLLLYFENNYLVKDDQIIIADCVFSNRQHFFIIFENDAYDNWFAFIRYLK